MRNKKKMTLLIVALFGLLLVGDSLAGDKKTDTTSGATKKAKKAKEKEAAKKKKAHKSGGEIMKFIKAEKGSVHSRSCLQIYAQPVAGGAKLKLQVSNQDNNLKKYDPIPAHAEVVKGLKSGDLIRITHKEGTGMDIIHSISKFVPRPGEEKANHFVFGECVEEASKKKSQALIKVTKYEVEQTLLLPLKKGKDGKLAPDPKLLEAVKACTSGDVVETKTKKSKGKLTLVSITVYVPPVCGEFVKLETDEADPAAASVVVKVDEAEQTVALPVVKGKADPKLLASIKRLKAGQTVEYTTQKAEDKTVLKAIKTVKKKK